MFQSEIKTSGFGSKVETFQLQILPCQVPTVLFRVGAEQDAFTTWLKAGCALGYLGTERANPQVPLSLLHCKVTVSGSTAGQGGQLQRGTVCPVEQHPGVGTTSDTAQGVFATEGWRLCCQKESPGPSVQVSPLCQPAQKAQSEERDGVLSHFLPRLPTTVLGNLYL